MKDGVLQSVVDSMFGTSFGYRVVRGIFHFGVRRAPIQKSLDLQPGEKLLDVGCGTGDYAPCVYGRDCSYLGIDHSPAFIEAARKRYRDPRLQFEVLDVRKMPYPEKSYDKALFVSILHHLGDDDAVSVLKAIGRMVKNRVVIVDLVPDWIHPINALLCKYDRGRFVRPVAAQRALIERAMKVECQDTYFVRSGIQWYSIFVAVPREPGC